MKVSEVIFELQHLKNLFGDIPVRAYPGFDTMYDLNENSFFIDGGKLYIGIEGTVEPNDFSRVINENKS